MQGRGVRPGRAKPQNALDIAQGQRRAQGVISRGWKNGSKPGRLSVPPGLRSWFDRLTTNGEARHERDMHDCVHGSTGSPRTANVRFRPWFDRLTTNGDSPRTGTHHERGLTTNGTERLTTNGTERLTTNGTERLTINGNNELPCVLSGDTIAVRGELVEPRAGGVEPRTRGI